MHWTLFSFMKDQYFPISGARRFLYHGMCIRGWEKWDAGILNGCTIRMHLVAGFCCDDGHKVSSYQVTTDTSEWFVEVTDIILRVFSSFTYPQIILIWGNFVAFYMINLILSAIPSLHMYTIMFRLCGQPSYWITMAVSLLLFHHGASFFSQFHYKLP